LLGTLTVICAFYLTREVFWQHKKRDIIALVAAGLLAVSPWHILLSRASYEANIATFFTVWVYFCSSLLKDDLPGLTFFPV